VVLWFFTSCVLVTAHRGSWVQFRPPARWSKTPWARGIAPPGEWLAWGGKANKPKHAPPKQQPPAPSPTPLPMSPALPYPAHESLALSRCAKAKGTRPDRQEARMHDRDSPECRPHVNGDGISAGEEGCRLTTAAPRSLVIPVPTTAQRARQAPSHTPHSSQQARATTATAWELPGHWTTGHGPHVDHTADRSPQSPQWQWQWHSPSTAGLTAGFDCRFCRRRRQNVAGLRFFLLFRAHFRQFATKLSAGRPDSYA
jgi:hypothetical protein